MACKDEVASLSSLSRKLSAPSQSSMSHRPSASSYLAELSLVYILAME